MRRPRPTSTSRCTPIQSTSGALPPVFRLSCFHLFSKTQVISRSVQSDILRASAVVTTPRKFTRGGATMAPSVLTAVRMVTTPSTASC